MHGDVGSVPGDVQQVVMSRSVDDQSTAREGLGYGFDDGGVGVRRRGGKCGVGDFGAEVVAGVLRKTGGGVGERVRKGSGGDYGPVDVVGGAFDRDFVGIAVIVGEAVWAGPGDRAVS